MISLLALVIFVSIVASEHNVINEVLKSVGRKKCMERPTMHTPERRVEVRIIKISDVSYDI